MPDVRYLSGFTGSSGVLWLAADAPPILITDSRYEEQAAEEVGPPAEVRIAREGWVAELGEVAGDSRRSVAFDPARLTVARLDELADKLSACEMEPAGELVSRLRAVKDEGERESIEAAARLAELAFQRTLEAIDWRGGPTEREVAARLVYELGIAGSGPLPFDVIVASGPRTALPHASPSARRIGRGDLVLFDLGARVDGYCSDITRNAVVGPAAAWQSELHEGVLDAQRKAIDAVAPEVPCADVDATVREALAEADWERYFGHSTGHGLGLEVHEAPSLSRRSEATLAEGNVVTVEPGVYLPGRGGVRIEDDIWVGKDGCRRLTSLPRELVEL